MTSSGLRGQQALMRYTYIHVGETHIYLKMVFLLRMMVNLVSVDASDGVSHTHKDEQHSSYWLLPSPSPQGKLLHTLPWFSQEVLAPSKQGLPCWQQGTLMFSFPFQPPKDRECRFSNRSSIQCSHQTEGRGGFISVGP